MIRLDLPLLEVILAVVLSGLAMVLVYRFCPRSGTGFGPFGCRDLLLPVCNIFIYLLLKNI